MQKRSLLAQNASQTVWRPGSARIRCRGAYTTLCSPGSVAGLPRKGGGEEEKGKGEEKWRNERNGKGGGNVMVKKKRVWDKKGEGIAGGRKWDGRKENEVVPHCASDPLTEDPALSKY